MRELERQILKLRRIKADREKVVADRDWLRERWSYRRLRQQERRSKLTLK
jgi:hypothetical protein